MNVKKNCRLCLQLTCNEKVYSIDKNTREMLEALLLNLSLKVTKDPVFCNECAASLQNYSHLKSTYVDIDNLPCPSKVDGQNTCRFCLKQTQTECLDLYETKENLFIVEMLSKHIPELNLYVTQNLLTCETCLVLLKSVHSFVIKCLDVEDRIKNYIELEGTDDSGHIELNYVIEIKPNLQHEAICDNWEDDTGSSCGMSDAYQSRIQSEGFIKQENLYIDLKNEESDMDIWEEDTASSCGISVVNRSGIQSEGFIKQENLYIDLKNEESDTDKMQNDGNRYEDRDGLKIKYQCSLCSYHARLKKHLKQHMLIHGIPSQIKLHNCDMCEFTAKRKDTFEQHMRSHKDRLEIKLHQCDMCPFASKRKGNLNKHRLIHLDDSDVQMHKCDVCPFQSKHKRVLTRHLQVHKKPTEATIYKCEWCPYKTNLRFNLKRHQVFHKNSSEVTIFMCEVCAYRTKIRADLTRHMMIHHTDSSEVAIYECDTCEFKTKIKYRLTRHILIHKDPATMFKCNICEYETRYTRALKLHMLVHKDPT